MEVDTQWSDVHILAKETVSVNSVDLCIVNEAISVCPIKMCEKYMPISLNHCMQIHTNQLDRSKY